MLVHSGSRGLGAAIAAHHTKAAEAHGEGELPGLHLDSEPGRACLSDIGWALFFARANREWLMREAAEVITSAIGAPPDGECLLDVVHNFVREEEHFGRKLLVHRKGAISAEAGKRLLIPGSMGTASYLVEGLGEPSSFQSGSHGAGRVMSRKQARQSIPPQKLAQAMRRVVYDKRRIRDLVEEAPAAYRDISEVLEDEADLVRPVLRLEPIAVLKG
ncbi:MAG: RtcB family protein [Myxococcaceae bacterium]